MRQTILRHLQRANKGFFLREMGYVLIIGGVVHLAAVTIVYSMHGFPGHDRVGYIYFIGVIQVMTGFSDLLASRVLSSDLKQGRYLALLSAIAIGSYVLIILPSYPDFSALFKLAPPIYLLYHWWVVLKLHRFKAYG